MKKGKDWLANNFSLLNNSSLAYVHGDYGSDNCLCSSEGKVNAVIDWAYLQIADPLWDVAYLSMWSQSPLIIDQYKEQLSLRGIEQVDWSERLLFHQIWIAVDVLSFDVQQALVRDDNIMLAVLQNLLENTAYNGNAVGTISIFDSRS